MGGILQPGTTIHGVVASPGIPLVDSPTGGFYEEANSGIGVSFGGANYQLIDNQKYFLGKAPSPAFGPVAVIGSPFLAQANFPVELKVSPDNRFLYVISQVGGVGQISGYTINLVSGVLTPLVGFPVAAGTNALTIAISPDGLHVIVGNPGDDTIGAYLRNVATGALTYVGAYATGAHPNKVLYAPDGLHVISCGNGGGLISVFTRNILTGVLTPVAGSPFTVGTNNYSIAISPDGNYLYATDFTTKAIQIARFNNITGSVVSIGSIPYVAAPASYNEIIVSPDNNSVLMTNYTNNNLSVYTRNISTGLLTEVVGSPYAVGTGPTAVIVMPDNLHVLVTNSGTNNITVFNRTLVTNILSIFVGSPLAVGLYPYGICASPDGRHFFSTDYTDNKVRAFNSSSVSSYHLVEAYYDPSGGAGGTFNINGQLQQNGMALLSQQGSDARYAQLTGQYVGTATGTGDAIVLTPAVPLVSYATAIGETLLFKASANNTVSPPTIAISGLAALNTTKGNVALPIGGIISGNLYYAFIESATSIRVSPFDAASVNGDTINGAMTFMGGVTVANPLPHFSFWPAFTSASGTDTAPVNGTRYISSLYLPYNFSMTGIAFLIGSVGGTDNVIVELHDNTGAIVATSALAGTLVGTANTMQKVPFTAPVAVKGPGIYYLVLQFNGATCRLKTVPAAILGLANALHTGSAAGTFGTSAAITPPAGFVADVGPIVTTY